VAGEDHRMYRSHRFFLFWGFPFSEEKREGKRENGRMEIKRTAGKWEAGKARRHSSFRQRDMERRGT
jgi:hypothetical protein